MTYKVLITGITGFVGSYLARHLLDLGNEVIGFMRRRADGQIPIRLKEMDIISEIDIINGDITNLSNIMYAIQEIKPDWIFHLAAQSFIPESFRDPISTFKINCNGTQNVLEAVRLKGIESKLIFAGSSEEYGLQFLDSEHFNVMVKKYGSLSPLPQKFPELPIDEEGNMRPMSPYAISKVFGDYVFRNYHITYGLNTIISRAFNHEGAGRGHNFVTSSIIRQLICMHLEEQKVMSIGHIQSFRDWSHVNDIINGYRILAEKGESGSIYVQGSMQCHSIISYILYSLSDLGYEISEISTLKNEKRIKDPLSPSKVKIGEILLNSNFIDEQILNHNLDYQMSDIGINIYTNKRIFKIQFDPSRFRPSDVPILLSNTNKIKKLGFRNNKKLSDIINDQISYYFDRDHRQSLLS